MSTAYLLRERSELTSTNEVSLLHKKLNKYG